MLCVEKNIFLGSKNNKTTLSQISLRFVNWSAFYYFQWDFDICHEGICSYSQLLSVSVTSPLGLSSNQIMSIILIFWIQLFFCNWEELFKKIFFPKTILEMGTRCSNMPLSKFIMHIIIWCVHICVHTIWFSDCFGIFELSCQLFFRKKRTERLFSAVFTGWKSTPYTMLTTGWKA